MLARSRVEPRALPVIAVPYGRVMTSDPLIFESTWPASTIDGIPSIVHGVLDLTCDPDGSVFMSLSVGPVGAAPEDCEYTEFVFSPNQAETLAALLASRPDGVMSGRCTSVERVSGSDATGSSGPGSRTERVAGTLVHRARRDHLSGGRSHYPHRPTPNFQRSHPAADRSSPVSTKTPQRAASVNGSRRSWPSPAPPCVGRRRTGWC